jgi:hypothetical protein
LAVLPSAEAYCAATSMHSVLAFRPNRHFHHEYLSRQVVFRCFINRQRREILNYHGIRVQCKNNTLGIRTKVRLTQRAHFANVLEGIVIEVAEYKQQTCTSKGMR